MEALFILLIFSLLLGGGFLAAFFWAQRTGQFDDTQTPALRILFDDADAARNKSGQSNTSSLNQKTTGDGKTGPKAFVSNAPAVRRPPGTSCTVGENHGS